MPAVRQTAQARGFPGAVPQGGHLQGQLRRAGQLPGDRAAADRRVSRGHAPRLHLLGHAGTVSAPAGDRKVPWPPPRTPAGLVSAVPTFVTPQRCLARQSRSRRAPLRGAPSLLACPGPGQDWGSCALCWEGTSACGSNTCWKEEESDPGAGNRPGPLSWVHTNPRGQRLRVAELVLALGRSLVPLWPDQAWGTGCIYIFVGYFALIKAVPALMLPA